MNVTPGTGSALTDVVVAFDLDNTLVDPDGETYRRTTANFLGFIDIGLNSSEVLRAYEGLRMRGDALERLGLGSPLHERNNPEAMAALCLSRATHRGLLRDLSINPVDQPDWRKLIVELAGLHDKTRRGSFDSRLAAEIEFQRLRATDPRLPRFCAEVRRVAAMPRITVWAQHYEKLARAEVMAYVRPLLDALVRREAVLLVISEGRFRVQTAKLDRLQVAEFFQDRVLITEQVAAVTGLEELDEAIAGLIGERMTTGADTESPELPLLWHYRCLIREWESKTPWFFGRCLHAVQNAPHRPELSLGHPVFVPAAEWEQRPLRFVMVGDRYDKDLAPLIDLLGLEVGTTVRLRAGKYGARDPEDATPPQRRPDRTFNDWDSLATFLSNDLTADQIPPITTAPAIVDPSMVTRDLIDSGLHSEYEAIRGVAQALAEMTDGAACGENRDRITE